MTDLAKTTHAAPDVMTLGAVFAKSGYFADARDAAQAVVKMLAGQELGFGPVASMTGIFIVKGRVTLSANLLAAAVKKGGKYNYRVVELSDAACKIDFYEGKEKIGESAFTMDDAKAAGLVNENYKKFARNMLFARAMSNGAKWFCADVFSGPVYTPDELGATIDMETGEMLARPGDDVPVTVGPVTLLHPELGTGAAPRNPTAELLAASGSKLSATEFAPGVVEIDFGEDGPTDIREQAAEIAEQTRIERAKLLGKLRATADMKKISAKERQALWEKHCGQATPETVDIAALGALLDAVRK